MQHHANYPIESSEIRVLGRLVLLSELGWQSGTGPQHVVVERKACPPHMSRIGPLSAEKLRRVRTYLENQWDQHYDDDEPNCEPLYVKDWKTYQSVAARFN